MKSPLRHIEEPRYLETLRRHNLPDTLPEPLLTAEPGLNRKRIARAVES